MASKQSKFKRSFPFLLALVVLISCLPVIPVAASTSYDVSGSWQFIYDVTFPYDRLLEFSYGFTTSDGICWDYFEMYDGDLWFSGEPGDVCFYDGGSDGGWSEGQSGVFDRVIIFPSGTLVDADSYDLLTTFASRYYVPIFSSIVTIDGQEFIFTSTTEQPAVLLQVTSTGAIMSYGDQTLYYIYPGSHIFLGLGASPSAAVFVPGGTYSLAAGDHVLYSVSRHVIDPDHPPTTDPFTATIVIDGRSFEFSGGDSYPVVRLGVGSSKVAFGLGDTVVNYWYPTPLGGQSFLGFSTSSDCTVVDYPVNEVNSPALSDPVIQFCDISFSQSNSVLTLYPVYSYSSSGGSGGSGSGSVDDPAGVGTILSRFAQFLVSPLMVFFNAEFIPGFSFGKLALVAFCFGLVFWLLRVSS